VAWLDDRLDDWHAYREALKRIDGREFQNASPAEKARAVSQLIRMTSAAAAVSALQPIPFVDTAILTPMQHRMVQSIATVHGYQLDRNDVREMFRAFRPRIMQCQLTIGLAKSVPLVPVIFDAVAVSVAYALTFAVGEASDQHFRSQRLTSPDEMRASLEVIYRETFDRAFQQKRNELRAMFRSPQIRREVEALKKAHRDGRMDEAEKERRMDEILTRSIGSSSIAGDPVGASSDGPASNDERSQPGALAARVVESLEKDASIHVRHRPIWAAVSDGVLSIGGEVADIASKRRALARVIELGEARRVIDRVRVAPAVPTEDGTVRAHVRDAFLGESAFDECGLTLAHDGREDMARDAGREARGSVHLSVEDGVVLLEGFVPTLAHKRLLETLAWWVPGTCDVRNALDVRSPEEENDDEISDAVRTALEKEPLVDAAQLRVDTRDGEVTLRGTLPSAEQRLIAERDAWCVPGVREVLDRIEIAR
jgi:osmotically-inducible protein OsmY/uncharacterized protein (DUF697 family)